MLASTKTSHDHSWLSRLIVSLTIGLMMLALGASAAFAGTGIQGSHVAANAPVITTGGGVTLDEDDEDDEDDGDDEEGGSGGGGSGGGGLPAPDTAPLAATGIVVTTGGGVSLDEDDEDDEDDGEDEEGGSGGGGSGGGGLPATDTAPLASSSDAGTPLPAVALLVIAGLAGGAMKVGAKRSVRS
jgi:hypothetical protein